VRYITKALQREANTALLAVCPPPRSSEKCTRKKDTWSGGGQNAKKLCKHPFVKPVWRWSEDRERDEGTAEEAKRETMKRKFVVWPI